MNWPILSVLVWLPIVGGIAVMLIGSERAQLAKQVALGTSILTFVLSIPLFDLQLFATADLHPSHSARSMFRTLRSPPISLAKRIHRSPIRPQHDFL